MSAPAADGRGRWVPIAEGLPPEHSQVAIRTTGGFLLTAWPVYWHGARNSFSCWMTADGEMERPDSITHWTTLPEQPE